MECIKSFAVRPWSLAFLVTLRSERTNDERLTTNDGFRVRTSLPIPLLKLFPSHNRLQVRHTINRQNAVQMINFMLQQLRKIPRSASLHLHGRSLERLILQRDLAMPL